MAWQPQQESLQQLAYSLRDSLSGYDRARQKQAEEVRQVYRFASILSHTISLYETWID